MELSPDFFGLLATLIGNEANQLRDLAANMAIEDRQIVADELAAWEHHLENEIETNASISSTEREALIMARRGQGLFRQRLSRIERMCRITKVKQPRAPAGESREALA